MDAMLQYGLGIADAYMQDRLEAYARLSEHCMYRLHISCLKTDTQAASISLWHMQNR